MWGRTDQLDLSFFSKFPHDWPDQAPIETWELFGICRLPSDVESVYDGADRYDLHPSQSLFDFLILLFDYEDGPDVDLVFLLAAGPGLLLLCCLGRLGDIGLLLFGSFCCWLLALRRSDYNKREVTIYWGLLNKDFRYVWMVRYRIYKDFLDGIKSIFLEKINIANTKILVYNLPKIYTKLLI